MPKLLPLVLMLAPFLVLGYVFEASKYLDAPVASTSSEQQEVNSQEIETGTHIRHEGHDVEDSNSGEVVDTASSEEVSIQHTSIKGEG